MRRETEHEITELLEREFRAGADPEVAATRVVRALRELGYSQTQAVLFTVQVVDQLLVQGQQIRRN